MYGTNSILFWSGSTVGCSIIIEWYWDDKRVVVGLGNSCMPLDGPATVCSVWTISIGKDGSSIKLEWLWADVLGW